MFIENILDYTPFRIRLPNFVHVYWATVTVGLLNQDPGALWLVADGQQPSPCTQTIIKI